MPYLCRTYGQSGGHGDPWTDEMDACTIAVSPELIELCRQREKLILALHADDDQLWELLFWHPDGDVCFYEFDACCYCTDSGEWPGRDDICEDLIAFVGPLEHEPLRIECLQMRVLVEGFKDGQRKPYCTFGFGAYRKNCDVFVTTPTWTLEYLESLLTSK